MMVGGVVGGRRWAAALNGVGEMSALYKAKGEKLYLPEG